MRSLTLTRAQVIQATASEGSTVAATAVDAENGTLYIATERQGDEGVEVEVVSLTPSDISGYTREVS